MNNDVTALVLRVTPTRGQVYIVQALTREYGRMGLRLVCGKMGPPAPFSLLEGTLASLRGDLGVLQNFSVVDSYVCKSLLLLRKIVESCMLPLTPSQFIWELILAILETPFSDWRAKSLLLALRFFEYEGVDPYVLSTMTTLSPESRELAQQLIASDIETWKKTEITDELLCAALESINVAKGGT